MAARKAAQKENKATGGRKVIVTNRKARHEYIIVDTWEAGIVLVGTEVKAMRDNKVSIVDTFAMVDRQEVWLHNLYIGEYDHGTWTNHAPRRTRKLLLHKKEILKLAAKVKEGSHTLIPLSLYFSDGRVKVELALARGKQLHDKRHSLMERQVNREISRDLGRRIKGIPA